MATRPTISVIIRADDATYTTGDPLLIGDPTKIARSGADISEGYKVDTVASPAAVLAQEVNYDDNVVDQWVKWVSEGTDAVTGDAHIVETDSTGDINTRGLNCVDVRVTPNTGTDGIEVTTSGGSKGVEVLQDATSTDFGFAVVSVDGASASSIFIDTRSTPGLTIISGDKPGISIAPVANGGVIGPSIDIQSNTLDPSDDGVGTMWNREQNGIDNVKMGMGSSAGWPIITKNAPCYARSATISGFSLLGSQTDQAIGSPFSFKTDQIPQDSDQVRVTIWGKISLNSNEVNSVELKVRDTTAGDVEICNLTIANPDTGSGVFEQQSATFSTVYTLPASGARTFDFVWEGDVNGASNGSFTGFIEIEQLRG